MPNCFFVAKRRWEADDRVGGLQTLNDCLERELGGPAFAPATRLFDSDYFASFESAVGTMLSDEHMRQTSFGKLFAILWRWHPDEMWISVLLNFNFFEHFERFGFDEELVEPLRQLGGFDEIVDALGESAANGLLAPDFEGPNSGRPTLRMSEVENVNEEHWGSLKQLLLRRLKAALDGCPNDCWARLAADQPEDVLIRFLHHLFGNSPSRMDVVSSRWKAITRDHSAYAAAVLMSLQDVLKNSSEPRRLTDVVRVDAGIMSVESGRQWLDMLLVALRSADFNSLPSR